MNERTGEIGSSLGPNHEMDVDEFKVLFETVNENNPSIQHTLHWIQQKEQQRFSLKVHWQSFELC